MGIDEVKRKPAFERTNLRTVLAIAAVAASFVPGAAHAADAECGVTENGIPEDVINVAQNGADGDSPYTKALAETIRKPGLDVFQDPRCRRLDADGLRRQSKFRSTNPFEALRSEKIGVSPCRADGFLIQVKPVLRA